MAWSGIHDIQNSKWVDAKNSQYEMLKKAECLKYHLLPGFRFLTAYQSEAFT